MTLKEAVAILNRRKHNERRGWWIRGVRSLGRWVECVGDDALTEFEAIAVAEKYQAEKVVFKQ